MPVIELHGEPREGIDTYGVASLAVMLFPIEDEARRNWQAAAMANAYSHWRKSGAPPEFLIQFHGWLGDVWELPQSPKRVFQDGLARIKRARLSGTILSFLLRLAQHHPEHCRVEQARALVREVLGERAPSESLLEKTWASFKTTSHLWQALFMAEGARRRVSDNAGWLRLFSVAEECRRSAESLRVLPAGETWRAPEWLPLPHAALEVEPLPPHLLEFLRSQFPTSW